MANLEEVQIRARAIERAFSGRGGGKRTLDVPEFRREPRWPAGGDDVLRWGRINADSKLSKRDCIAVFT